MGWNGQWIRVGTLSWPWRRKFSHHSSQDPNSQPFDHRVWCSNQAVRPTNERTNLWLLLGQLTNERTNLWHDQFVWSCFAQVNFHLWLGFKNQFFFFFFVCVCVCVCCLYWPFTTFLLLFLNTSQNTHPSFSFTNTCPAHTCISEIHVLILLSVYCVVCQCECVFLLRMINMDIRLKNNNKKKPAL